MICGDHKWKIIRTEEGQRESLLGLLGFKTADVIIYHLQCVKCGFIVFRELPVVNRGYHHKILKETKWPL